jgi:exopolysaccharide biosynthesis polyprenyl glycosylphosphotransferase
MWRGYLSRLKRKGKLVQRTLIVGTNQAAAEVASTLTHTRLGYHPIGYVALSLEQPSPDGLPCLGSIDQLDDVISRCPADCLFVASAGVSAHDMVHIASVARRFEVEIRLSASLPNTLTTRIHVHPVGDLMTISLKPVRLTRSQDAVKRISDIVLASIALIATLPLQLLIALIIKCTSGGPVLFRQRRVTKAGRVFEMYKFRTMISDGGRSSDVNSMDVTEPFYKLRNDARLTRVGRLLRVYSLDEFPQLFNVIRGDMSLVGPRPLPAEQVAKNLKLLRPRHEVCAGMTGWWQIHGRSLVSAEEALRLDLFYIENWSLSLDLYILLRTFGSLIARRGAF